MSERRYTESQMLATLRKYWPMGDEAQYRKYLSTLTPDPEPSGEVVERIRDVLKDTTIFEYGYEVKNEWLVLKLGELLTAEVTRQVEERTKVYREALEKEAEYDWAGRPINGPARALANKGGSDE